tara:strand:+ start:289 stop:501 length:213 start_codon:yes stop_codon:yes gene_type:complete
MKIGAHIYSRDERKMERRMVETLIEKSLVSKAVIKASTGSNHDPASHEDRDVNLYDYDDYDALDEIMVGM